MRRALFPADLFHDADLPQVEILHMLPLAVHPGTAWLQNFVSTVARQALTTTYQAQAAHCVYRLLSTHCQSLPCDVNPETVAEHCHNELKLH